VVGAPSIGSSNNTSSSDGHSSPLSSLLKEWLQSYLRDSFLVAATCACSLISS